MTDSPRTPPQDTDAEETPRQDERLTRRLASLPRKLEPRRDLWPGIEARIATSTDRATQSPPGAGSRRRSLFPTWALWAGLAAALLVVAVPWIAVPWLRSWLPLPQNGPHDSAPTVTGPAAVSSPLLAAPVLAWQARQEDDAFVTRQALEMAVGTARETGSLPPEAVAGVEESLYVLDQAIGETRAALDRFPTDPQLRLLLAERYQQEAALLHRIDSL